MSLVADLVQQLESDSLERHADAFAQLLRMGDRALPELSHAVMHSTISDRLMSHLTIISEMRTPESTDALLEIGRRILVQTASGEEKNGLLAETIRGLGFQLNDRARAFILSVCDYPSAEVQNAVIDILEREMQDSCLNHLEIISLHGVDSAKRNAARAVRRIRRQRTVPLSA